MRINKLLVTLAFSMFFNSGTAIAADWDVGSNAYQLGDYKTALKEWAPLAEQGYARAQFMLGVMYDEGEGVPTNYKTSVKWLTLAAEQGLGGAQVLLGFSYEFGTGVLTNYARAYMWYNLAAYNGGPTATENKDTIAEKMTSAQIYKAQEMSDICLASGYTDC